MRNKSLKLLFVALIILAIFFVNSFHEEYPDEYDSIVGGRYLLEGKVQYRDWFQHHNPSAYVLAALILPFSGRSFVHFRIILGPVFFLINLAGFFLLTKRLKQKIINLDFYLIYLLFLAVAGTYFWWQMLLADTLSSYLLIPPYAFLLFKSFSDESFSLKDLFLTGLFSFFAWWSSMSYTYVVFALDAYALFLFLQTEKLRHRLKPKTLLVSFSILAAPYFIFFIYLVASGSLKDYYFAAITYNQNYYIYNAGNEYGHAVNPLRYSITLAMNFFNSYFPALAMIKGFNLEYPLVVFFALSHIIFFSSLALSKNWRLFVFSLFILIYGSVRANPVNIVEHDYQSSLYVMLSIFNGFLGLILLKKNLAALSDFFVKVLFSLLLAVYTVFLFFSVFRLALVFAQKFYTKYMGQAPLVYDNPQIAPLVNRIAGKNEYVWVGPFEFKELLYLDGKMPSKYHWFLQHAVKSKIKDEMLADFTKNRAKLIVFQREYTPWQGPPHEFNYFFTDFLDKYYFRIYKLNDTLNNYKYVWKVGNTRNFDLDGSFNFDLQRKDEILAELQKLAIIEKVKK